MAFVVRAARETDLSALFELLRSLHDVPPWDAHEQEQAAQALQLIVSDPQRALLIAESEGAAVGTIDVGVSINLTRNVSPFAVIENVVVLPRARRKGFGRALVESAIDFAAAQGCYKVQLVSANTRDAAHHLYEATGFDADVSGYRRYLRSS